ncbi:aminotransferase class I/II-fold pyridoxal phosphate-dependent enzyme [Sporobacter termitidis]|uniref:aminotransferase class I/II-fold pyridoxal phosphate-dependent enzyme n=1 Tax=Sporobacter termitidis TaxID=44749 RepID=UPI003119E82E
MDQSKTPLFDAVKKYAEDKVIPFHVPGHKQGNGLREYGAYFGQSVLKTDVNGMEGLDFYNNPSGVILESEQLLAEAYGAAHAFFLVNGTTAGVQAMVLSACKPGDELILPRNAHKSAVGGMILSGAVPVYVQPEYSEELGIAMSVTPGAVERAIRAHSGAAALLLLNPTYYGAAADIETLVQLAHSAGVAALADEAHGAHLPFHPGLPLSAMAAGADMSAVSLHKTAGALTQCSALLLSGGCDPARAGQALSLLSTASASYILMCSIDLARKQLALRGEEMLDETLRLVRLARRELAAVDGLRVFGRELIGTPGCFDFDETKLGVSVRDLGYTGYEVEEKLRKEYNIQIELSDMYNILAVVTLGDSAENLRRLVDALKDIARHPAARKSICNTIIPEIPDVAEAPREAFFGKKKAVRLEDAAGEIAGEMLMAYPPGIPVIGIGERITGETVAYIRLLKTEKCQLQGTADPAVDYIEVLAKSGGFR